MPFLVFVPVIKFTYKLPLLASGQNAGKYGDMKTVETGEPCAFEGDFVSLQV